MRKHGKSSPADRADRIASIDALVIQCHLPGVKTKKSAASEAERKTQGMRLGEKYRPRMSRLTDAERQKLMARGLTTFALDCKN